MWVFVKNNIVISLDCYDNFFHYCVKCRPMTLPLACSQVSLTSGWSIPICTPGWGKDWTLRVKCLSQEHNTITQATTWTQITQSLKFYNNSQGSTTKIRVGCMNQSKYYTRLKIKNPRESCLPSFQDYPVNSQVEPDFLGLVDGLNKSMQVNI